MNETLVVCDFNMDGNLCHSDIAAAATNKIVNRFWGTIT